MSTVHPVESEDLRVIMCLAFDLRAPAADVAAFKSALMHCPYVVNCCTLSGTFDLMIEASLPSLAAYNEKLEGMREALASLVSRYEANFVCKRFVRAADADDRAVWVPCRNGLRRIDCSQIDKVVAEGDYMRVHAGAGSWLIHATLREMLEKLGDDQFVRLHRSVVARTSFIERLIHERRRWTARLNDGSSERIAKSHVAEVVAKLRTASSKPEQHSPKDGAPAEDQTQSRRKAGALAEQE